MCGYRVTAKALISRLEPILSRKSFTYEENGAFEDSFDVIMVGQSR